MFASLLFCLFLLSGFLFYHRAGLLSWIFSIFSALILSIKFNGVTVTNILTLIFFIILFVPLTLPRWRKRLLSAPLFNFYKKVMPHLSKTEREAIAAGTITWEGNLFRGNPNWKKLLSLSTSQLTTEEKDFLQGPVETLCTMLDEWKIRHQLNDLPESVWVFLKKEGFFGLIIPKEYGGKQFSAYAQSQILVKVSSKSITAASTIGVPNSLGPAELLLHYGTLQQKQYYLPRLARGEEIPCFALTSPDAGSDAGSMSDHGVITYGDFEGKKTLGIRLNWQKRYITLAPIATVIGLAFKLYDPEHLLGLKRVIGITCALIPRHTLGITIGRRHNPLNTPFQNGPIIGKDVFIPLDYIIGGVQQAGNGWRMLMECLAAGRAITLPSCALGGTKAITYASGAYARIRRQFNQPIGRFEGIEAPLARIAMHSYMIDAARLLTISRIDQGEKPSVASAIIKYYATEQGRQVAIDAMDIHGGKGICLGPNNYLGAGYISAPIAVTVEGANILTRNMIIFGQGAIRCHPYVLKELEAAQAEDLRAFDKAIIKHINFGISNVVRCLFLALTSSFFVSAKKGNTKRYFQHATRFSSALALFSDISMLYLGSQLKRKESLSARLGDVLSYLYLMSAALKHFHEQGGLEEDLPLIKKCCEDALYHIQESFNELIENFPNRIVKHILKWLIFPLGKNFKKPKDYLNHKIAQLLVAPTNTRQRLSEGAFLSNVNGNLMADLQDALLKTIEAEPIEKLIRNAHKEHFISGYNIKEQAQSALKNQIITEEQFDKVIEADEARSKIIAVDDFASEELERRGYESEATYLQSIGGKG